MFSGASAGAHGLAAPRILLVDDDRDLLVPLADQLRHDGFDVTTARDGEEALRRLDTAWPDLLIIDLLMPRMDGYELAGRLREEAPGKSPFLVAVSGCVSPEEHRRSAAAGIDLHLDKPAEPAVLVGVLRRFARGLAPA